eukprot:TRINITY_DN7113_c0_g2_i1.p1 TRINITY_DN7113_c0_g2~~TRINITY_DN7113_c0_g2_i1.p1  ORF type:complete len:308 (+),score=39.72 TRINITY_DN7113_c0_g2_i1:37-960(+)
MSDVIVGPRRGMLDAVEPLVASARVTSPQERSQHPQPKPQPQPQPIVHFAPVSRDGVSTPAVAEGQRMTSPTRRRENERHVTLTKLPHEPLGCKLEHMILTGVKDRSPADRCGAAEFIGLRLTGINQITVATEQDLLNALRGLHEVERVTLQFSDVTQDSRWAPGVPYHAAHTPQEAFPPTYLHPPPEGRVAPLPPSTSPLLFGGGFGFGSPMHAEAPDPHRLGASSARARSAAVCARAGFSRPLSSDPTANTTYGSYFAVDRTPTKFQPPIKTAAPYLTRPLPDPVGVGDPNIGLSNATLPPWAGT